MKNDTKNIHLCFENLFISEDKQDENTNNYGRIWETRYNLKSPKHKIERGLVLDIEPTNTYRRKILRMLDTFVSLMYCSHLSIKPTQFMLGEKHESEETRYNQSETAHKTIFRCWDSNHIWVKNSENARNFCNYYELSSSHLLYNKYIIHKLLAVFITFLTSWKLLTHLIYTISENYHPPIFFYSKSSHIKNNLFHACNM